MKQVGWHSSDIRRRRSSHNFIWRNSTNPEEVDYWPLGTPEACQAMFEFSDVTNIEGALRAAWHLVNCQNRQGWVWVDWKQGIVTTSYQTSYCSRCVPDAISHVFTMPHLNMILKEWWKLNICQEKSQLRLSGQVLGVTTVLGSKHGQRRSSIATWTGETSFCPLHRLGIELGLVPLPIIASISVCLSRTTYGDEI